MLDHALYMRRCFELAQLAKGFTAPNPMVGAVLVHNGRIIGEGWHRQYGEAHAEVICLENVSATERHLIPESTMYVNLEPCAHHGKTPPCAARLVEEKVKEVIVCNSDPFEKVGGKGLQILQEHNIGTETGLLETGGLWLNRRFFCFHQQKRPYIILKWAQTTQGYFAPLNGTCFQISNEHSKQLLHKWRTEETAILVGYNTAMNDNPQLTSRLHPGKQPLRIVLDKNLSLPVMHKIFDNETSTWIINAKKETTEGHINYLKLDFDNGLLPQLLERMHDANILSLVVEGGAQLLQSFIEAGLWDEARIFVANADLEDGIRAPLLPNAINAFDTELGSDCLHVYTHKKNPYNYVPGMEL